jgi:hypothetical protein
LKEGMKREKRKIGIYSEMRGAGEERGKEKRVGKGKERGKRKCSGKNQRVEEQGIRVRKRNKITME